MGKGGGPLSMWIKEFTALVFTQTIQAFIYAIIISIILFGMVNTSGISADDNNASLGLMATFALLSVFKVEDLLKRILGIGDTKAGRSNAMKSLAKTAIAAKLGGKVLNNAGKVLGGVRQINQAGQDRKKAKKRMDEDMKDNGFELKNGELKPTAARASSSRSASTRSGGGSSSTGGGNGSSTGSGSGSQTSYSSGGDSQMSEAAYRRAKSALRTFEDKAAEIQKSRNEGIKSILSGTAETIGATFGTATGALIGGADGDFDEMIQGALAGAGVGDVVGKNAVEAIDRATKFVERNYKREAGMTNKQLQKAIGNYKNAINNASVNYKLDVDDIDV